MAMPLDHGYGVVVGTFAAFSREDPNHFGHWYHGKLRISTPAGEYEAALDVDTPSGVGVSYRLVPDLSTADIPTLHSLPPGFTSLRSTPASGALDYVRSPLLRDGWLVTCLRRVLARIARGALPVTRTSTVPQVWAPTRLDALLRWLLPVVERLWPRLAGRRWRSLPWVRSDGDNALNVLEPLLHDAARLYVLGEPYTTGRGVHNVHMNQGDPPGPHQAEDGIWQDGAVICAGASGAVHIWQIKFNTQSLHTDGHGRPI
jgi:hypothetical protein